MDVIDDTDDAIWSPQSKAKKVRNFSTSWSVSRPKSTAVKNIDIDTYIADILESEISVNIDIGNGNIDPALVLSDAHRQHCFDHARLNSAAQFFTKL